MSEHEAQLYNSRIIDTYLKLIKSKYPFVKVDELLAAAGMTPSQAADPGEWFTQSQVDSFHTKLRSVTGNSSIAREAGRYGASPEALGSMRHYMLSMIGPSKMYEGIGKTAPGFTRSSVYKSKRLAPNRMEIVVTQLPGVQEKPFQCENRSGFLEAISLLYQEKLPRVEHPECIFRGDGACRYLISWEPTGSGMLEALKWYLDGGLCAGTLLSYLLTSPATFRHVLVGSLLTALSLRLLRAESGKRALAANMAIAKERSDELLERIDVNYNHAMLTEEIGQAISRQTSIEEVLASVAQVLERRLDFARGMLFLADEEKTKLTLRAGFGYPERRYDPPYHSVFRLDRPESQGVFAECFREQKPFLVNNFCEADGTISLRCLEFAKTVGSESFICSPIISDGDSMGILAVANPRSGRPLVHSDISLIMGIAPMIGMAIYNAKLSEAKFRQFSSFLKVMAASIDARDPLTAGHSEKVTEYAVGICGELKLSPAVGEMIRVAALLHDYGKIGVPDAILKKNGKLSAMEYEIVKTHCHKTRDILDQVNFEGIYSQVPQIAGAHHEKIDGTGYPKGLKGEEIPLGARILAVADFFEAVTSKRHYRDPMVDEEAFRLLKEGAGKHFDREVVEALIRYIDRMHRNSRLTLVGTG